MPKLALGAAVALGALSLSTGAAHAACDPASPANTCRVTVGGLQYDVTTFTGSYNSDTSKFAPPPAPGVMPWWGSQASASAFFAAVGGGLGYPNAGVFTPYFAYSQVGNGVNILYADNTLVQQQNQTLVGDIAVYAQATLYTAPAAAVPGPLPLFGAAAAFGFSRKLRKRIQESRLSAGSGEPLA